MDKGLLERLKAGLVNPDNHPTVDEMLHFEASVRHVLQGALQDQGVVTVTREGGEAVIHIRSNNPELLKSIEVLGYRNMKGIEPNGA